MDLLESGKRDIFINQTNVNYLWNEIYTREQGHQNQWSFSWTFCIVPIWLLKFLSVGYKYCTYIIYLDWRIVASMILSQGWVNKIDLEVCHTRAMKLLSNVFIIMNNLLIKHFISKQRVHIFSF